MLTRALENSESDLCKPRTTFSGEEYQPVHISRNEVKVDYYGFPFILPEYWARMNKPREYVRQFYRGQRIFIKSDIPNYAAVNLAITRTITRLQRRGLIGEEFFYGLSLTDKGREEARKLLATQECLLT